MRDPWDDAGLAHVFATHARTSLPRAPLNSALSTIIAEQRSMWSLLTHAAPHQRQPVLLLAAIHHLLLGDPTHPLAAWYPTITDRPRRPDDQALAAELRRFVSDRPVELLALVADRHVQTNEVGRCALLLPPIGAIERDLGRPIALLDVGTSAGLTLLLDQLGVDYHGESTDDTHSVGSGTIRLSCGLRGRLPTGLPTRLPTVADARGMDPRPIDPTDPEDARWLLACCWPDELDRFRRLRRALDLAAASPPAVTIGSTDDVDALVAGTSPDHHPVVTTSWVLTYVDPPARRRFLTALDELGDERDLDWVFAESPAQTPELPHPPQLRGEHVTAVVWVSWRSGHQHVTHVARAHPHGHWMHQLV